MAPAPIAPDTEDWTRVLERPCPECRSAAAAVEPAGSGRLLAGNARRRQEVLGRPAVRSRPEASAWSALEHHLHDVVFHLRDIGAG